MPIFIHSQPLLLIFEPNFMFLTRNSGFWCLTCVFYHFGALALVLECYHAFMVYGMHFHPTTAFPTLFWRLSHISSNNNYCQPFSIVSGLIYTKPAASGHTHSHSLSLVTTLNRPVHSQQIAADFDSFQPSEFWPTLPVFIHRSPLVLVSSFITCLHMFPTTVNHFDTSLQVPNVFFYPYCPFSLIFTCFYSFLTVFDQFQLLLQQYFI